MCKRVALVKEVSAAALILGPVALSRREAAQGGIGGLIHLFERVGWATDVHWPDVDLLARRRLGSSPLPALRPA